MEQLLAAPPLGLVVPEWVGAVPAREAWLRQVKASGVHVVVFGGAPEQADFDHVMSDHEQGSYDVTRWLISQGRKRILNLWPKPGDWYWCVNRRRGYERAMREAGLEALPTDVFGILPEAMPDIPGWGGGNRFEVASHLFAGYLAGWMAGADPVDAILLVNDGFVAPVAAGLRILGKKPGRDVLLAGYDNFWSGVSERAFESTPPSVSVDQRSFEMGQKMIRMLLDRAAGRLPEGPQCRAVKPKLVFFDEVNASEV